MNASPLNFTGECLQELRKGGADRIRVLFQLDPQSETVPETFICECACELDADDKQRKPILRMSDCGHIKKLMHTRLLFTTGYRV